MRLGLVCMKTTTKMQKRYTGINAYNKATDKHERLLKCTLHNISETKKCLEWVIENKTGMYRFSSDLVPFAELWEWKDNPLINLKLSELRKMCIDNNIRTTIHPSQFCVLNSENPTVVENSISILKYHAILCDKLSINNIIVHTGSSRGDYASRFIEVCNSLPDNIKSRICLENCHKVDIMSVINICEECKIKPILDLHHNRICGIIDVSKVMKRIQVLWGDEKPVGHISSGRKREDDKAHHDFIVKSDIDKFYSFFSDFDLEIEAKKKDSAIIKCKEYLYEKQILTK